MVETYTSFPGSALTIILGLSILENKVKLNISQGIVLIQISLKHEYFNK